MMPRYKITCWWNGDRWFVRGKSFSYGKAILGSRINRAYSTNHRDGVIEIWVGTYMVAKMEREDDLAA